MNQLTCVETIPNHKDDEISLELDFIVTDLEYTYTWNIFIRKHILLSLPFFLP